jgi:hypothetical protein
MQPHNHAEYDNKRAPDLAMIVETLTLSVSSSAPNKLHACVERLCGPVSPLADKTSRLNRFFQLTPTAKHNVLGPADLDAFYKAIKTSMMENRRHGDAFRLFVECQETKLGYLVETGTKKHECSPGKWHDVQVGEVVEERGEPAGVQNVMSLSDYLLDAKRVVSEERFGLVACAVVGYRCTQISDFYEENKNSECFVKNGWSSFEPFVEYLIGNAPPEAKDAFMARAAVGFLTYIHFFRLFVKCPNIVLVSNVGCAGIMHHALELEQRIVTDMEEMECWHLGDYGTLFSWIKHESRAYDEHRSASTLSRDLITHNALKEVVDLNKEVYARARELKKARTDASEHNVF